MLVNTVGKQDAEMPLSATAEKSGAGGASQSGEATLYDMLGVSEHATDAEIKRAYYRLVRQFHPGSNPEEFQKVNDASKTLLDARRRGEYDQLRRSGRRVQVLVDQAAAVLNTDAQKAVTLLKSAIALAPDMPRPRHLLAQVLIRIEEYALAERQYRWLIREFPANETLHYRLARCLWLQKRYPDAERSLAAALRLNPCYYDALLLQSRIYEARAMGAEAAQSLEKAIAADSRETYADFDAICRLLTLHLQSEDADDIQQTTQRLLSVIPSNDEEKANRAAQRLMLLADDFFDAGSTRVSLALLRIAHQITGASEQILQEVATLYRRFQLSDEARQLNNDPHVETPLKQCFTLKYLNDTPEAQRAQRIEETLSLLQEEIQQRPRQMGVALDYLCREYPALTQEQNALTNTLKTLIQRRLHAAKQEPLHVMPGGSAETPEPEPPRPPGRFFGLFHRKSNGANRPRS